jgi:hypothetical protein
MIEIGTLVMAKSQMMGMVTEIHDTGHSKAYRVKWFSGKSGVVSRRQFEVIA